ncbi:MAG: hypothetical protein Q4F11_03010 [Eubacteriales bacterium]|nr:hypothetical protein [Eubacteriales bacterium]
MAKIYPITEFDSITLPAMLQIFKAIIPFMDYDMQRSISTVIRADELIHTINFYKSPANCKCFKSCSSDFCISSSSSIQEILNNEKILNMILKYCPEEAENMLNQFKSFSSMSDLFNVFHQGSTNANGFTFDEKTLLNPSQQNLYNQYIHQLDQIDLSKK